MFAMHEQSSLDNLLYTYRRTSLYIWTILSVHTPSSPHTGHPLSIWTIPYADYPLYTFLWIEGEFFHMP